MNSESKSKSLLLHRKISLTAGILYLLTFVSIPSIALYSQVKGANYIVGSGTDTSAILAGLSEVIVALAGIATAVVLYPIIKKQSEGLALGLVAARILEASCIFLGVAFLMSVVTLRLSGAGADSLIVSKALVTLYDRIFLLSQSFIPGINDLILGYLLYKSRLVPHAISMVGMIGAVPLFAGFLAMMFGLVGRSDPIVGLAALMVALFEFSLGIWLVVKGFNSEAALALESK